MNRRGKITRGLWLRLFQDLRAGMAASPIVDASANLTGYKARPLIKPLVVIVLVRPTMSRSGLLVTLASR